VNRVGVDVSTFSGLPPSVAGIAEQTALNILRFCDENGRFTDRTQLNMVF
jgi:transcriptional accessory protein Tex/SPT6